MSIRQRVWDDMDRDAAERMEKARHGEWRNIFMDESAATFDLQRWLALEQLFNTDGWTALVSWLGEAHDKAIQCLIDGTDRARIRTAPGTARLASDLLNLPQLVARGKDQARKDLEAVEQRKGQMREAERSAESLTA